MNILILGSGAREHSIAYSLSKSPTVHKVYACPGNAGMKELKIVSFLPFKGNVELVKFCKDKIDLAVVGSTRFVQEGTVDALKLAGIPVVGAVEDAGKIETSKAFAASFITRHSIPSPMTLIAVNRHELEAIIPDNPWIKVIKSDGYSKGTGVAIVDNPEDALDTAINFLKVHGPPVVLQEKLRGVECSYSILTDGNQWVSFSSCRDYKRAHEGDAGPTTGGLGSVSPSPDLTPELEQKIIEKIVEPVVAGMREDNLLYHGFLSIQLMLTKHGPRVLEFNARLGDPETQSILTRFRGDLATLLSDCAKGCLTSVGSEVAFGKHSAVSVVLAREGYPESEEAVPSIKKLDKITDSHVFYSKCDDKNGDLEFNSGRLMSVTALGEDLEEAYKNCYNDISKLDLKNVSYRKDIGKVEK